MKKLLLAALAAFQTMIVVAQVATVSGPDGRLKVNIDVKGGKPVYAVTGRFSSWLCSQRG